MPQVHNKFKRWSLIQVTNKTSIRSLLKPRPIIISTLYFISRSSSPIALPKSPCWAKEKRKDSNNSEHNHVLSNCPDRDIAAVKDTKIKTELYCFIARHWRVNWIALMFLHTWLSKLAYSSSNRRQRFF